MRDDPRVLLMKHLAASPANVLLVMVTQPAPSFATTYGIFRVFSRAEEWANNEGDDEASAVFVPFVVDEPEFGNVPRKALA